GLPPMVELPPSIASNPAGGSGIHGSGPLVQTGRSKKRAPTSVQDRLRKRSNPMAIFFAVVIVMVIIGVGVASVLWDRAEKAKRQFAAQMIGNWELVPGQSQLERWDFAFHDDRKLQMALGTQLSEGWWKVTSVQGSTGYVLIEWPDEAPETMRVRFDGGTMQVQLESVGNFAFRPAVP
ncbi:MAG TPA: hypothetical protein P5307_24275, partial [Pirellulaceae bacterium]|nr:hypothetical protein [Pirellulaceae bacterium]